MDFHKIAQLAQTPRAITPEVEKISPRPSRLFRKAREQAVQQWEQEMAHAPIVLAGVVQANSVLYSPETAQWAPGVLAWTTDPSLAVDPQFVRQLADTIASVRGQRTGDPQIDALGAQLEDEQSEFVHQPVPLSLTQGVPAKVTVTYLNPGKLPGGAIPAHGLLPAIIRANPDRFDLLPPEVYS